MGFVHSISKVSSTVLEPGNEPKFERHMQTI